MQYYITFSISYCINVLNKEGKDSLVEEKKIETKVRLTLLVGEFNGVNSLTQILRIAKFKNKLSLQKTNFP